MKFLIPPTFQTQPQAMIHPKIWRAACLILTAIHWDRTEYISLMSLRIVKPARSSDTMTELVTSAIGSERREGG